MKINISLILAAIAAIGVAPLMLSGPTLAEETNTSSPTEVQQPQIENNRDTFNNTQGDRQTQLNPFDLIHQVRLGNSRSMEQFQQDQQQNLNDAAAQFRARQQQLLLQQQPVFTNESEGADSTVVTPEGN